MYSQLHDDYIYIKFIVDKISSRRRNRVYLFGSIVDPITVFLPAVVTFPSNLGGKFWKDTFLHYITNHNVQPKIHTGEKNCQQYSKEWFQKAD